MSGTYIPNINLVKDIGNTKLSVHNTPFRMESINSPEAPVNFKGMLINMANELDATTKAPDQVMQDAILGNNADIHDVMIAVSKAEIGVNMATQITTKVIQSYEKVMAIQV